MKFISAVCPNCKAKLELSGTSKATKCNYCGTTLIIEDTLKNNNKVFVDGIQTDRELINSANELLDMGEFIKAKKLFEKFSIKNPNKYQGWLGLLICRTRNFTIKDNNFLFENDIKKYFTYFNRTAPSNIKEEYFEIIDKYINPEKYENIEKKEEKLKKEAPVESFQMILKVINKILCYFTMFLFLVMALGSFFSGDYLVSIISVIVVVLFSPNIKILILKHSFLDNKMMIIARISIIILWFVILIISI